jgi:hypothetical protein
MAAYWITQFKKVNHHKIGAYNVDLKRVGDIYPNILAAEKALAKIMDTYRHKAFVRIDHNVASNPVAYADLDESGGIVRFLSRDKFHWTSAITLGEFKARLARRH